MNANDEMYLISLELEVQALRSVLAEFEGDKYEYTQMLKADAMQDVRNHLRRPQ